MLDAFASVGVRVFDITFTNIKEDNHGRREMRGFEKNRSLTEVWRSLPRLLANASEQQNNIIIRPHNPPGVAIIQFDDLDTEKAERLTAHAFIVIRNRPDISRADFPWCRTAIEWGWGIEDTARRLMELSSKAKENATRF